MLLSISVTTTSDRRLTTEQKFQEESLFSRHRLCLATAFQLLAALVTFYLSPYIRLAFSLPVDGGTGPLSWRRPTEVGGRLLPMENQRMTQRKNRERGRDGAARERD